MAKVGAIEMEGIVVAALPNASFQRRGGRQRARKHRILAHISGKMRKYYIRILPGDTVVVEVSPYDLDARSHRLPAVADLQSSRTTD